jgi:hypothetical protein
LVDYYAAAAFLVSAAVVLNEKCAFTGVEREVSHSGSKPGACVPSSHVYIRNPESLATHFNTAGY